MPLHDWNVTKGWSGVHLLWMTEVLRWIKPRLPEGYRAYVGTSPVVAVDDPAGEPDISVRRANPPAPPTFEDSDADPFQPDWEAAVATVEEDRSVYVERGGRMVAAVELVSPGNKIGRRNKAKYLTRYLGYLTNRVHVLVVDVHPRPHAYSFADEIAKRLGLAEPASTPAPFAVSYRVSAGGEPGDGVLSVRQNRLSAGTALPTLPLAIGFPSVVPVDLEATYMRAAADAYLD